MNYLKIGEEMLTTIPDCLDLLSAGIKSGSMEIVDVTRDYTSSKEYFELRLMVKRNTADVS